MVVECVGCGEFHELTPADMILIITAYQAGEVNIIGGTPVQVTSLCMMTAFHHRQHTEHSEEVPSTAAISGSC
jgi:hypothetical protein